MTGHHREIGRAILLPYRAQINTLLPMLQFFINICGFEYLIFYVKILLIVILVKNFGYLSSMLGSCLIFLGFVQYRLYKAPTDYTKPQQTVQSPEKTIQRPEILDKTKKY